MPAPSAHSIAVLGNVTILKSHTLYQPYQFQLPKEESKLDSDIKYVASLYTLQTYLIQDNIKHWKHLEQDNIKDQTISCQTHVHPFQIILSNS